VAPRLAKVLLLEGPWQFVVLSCLAYAVEKFFYASLAALAVPGFAQGAAGLCPADGKPQRHGRFSQ
jgi:hypothetical protein